MKQRSNKNLIASMTANGQALANALRMPVRISEKEARAQGFIPVSEIPNPGNLSHVSVASYANKAVADGLAERIGVKRGSHIVNFYKVAATQPNG